MPYLGLALLWHLRHTCFPACRAVSSLVKVSWAARPTDRPTESSQCTFRHQGHDIFNSVEWPACLDAVKTAASRTTGRIKVERARA